MVLNVWVLFVVLGGLAFVMRGLVFVIALLYWFVCFLFDSFIDCLDGSVDVYFVLTVLRVFIMIWIYVVCIIIGLALFVFRCG